MTETIERAALIAEAQRMSRYVQNGGPDDGTVYDRLAVALADAERELATALAEARRYNNLYRGALTPAKWGTPPVQPNA